MRRRVGSHHLKELDNLVGLPKMPKGIVEYDVAGIDIIAPDREHRLRMAGPTTSGFSFNRLKLGQWMLSIAEDAGATVMASTRVKRLMFDGGKVSGVRITEEGSDSDKELTAKIVVDATGGVGMLRRQLPESSPVERTIAKEDFMVAVRDIYETLSTPLKPRTSWTYIGIKNRRLEGTSGFSRKAPIGSMLVVA